MIYQFIARNPLRNPIRQVRVNNKYKRTKTVFNSQYAVAGTCNYPTKLQFVKMKLVFRFSIHFISLSSNLTYPLQWWAVAL